MIFLGIVIGAFIGVGIMCIVQINRTNKYLYKYELLETFTESDRPLKAYCIVKDSDKYDLIKKGDK